MARKFLSPITPPALSSDPASAPAGSIYYNTVAGALKIFNGSTWSSIAGGSATSIQSLASAPSSPTEGQVYFDTVERTLKVYNGSIWQDAGGPKQLIDHQHYAGDGYVKYASYGTYVENNELVFMDGGSSTSTFTGDIIDGGNS